MKKIIFQYLFYLCIIRENFLVYSHDRSPQFKILNLIIIIELKSTISLQVCVFFFKKKKKLLYCFLSTVSK